MTSTATTAAGEAGARLLAIVDKTGPDGQPRYDNDTALDVLGLVLLASLDEELDPVSAQVLAAFAARVELPRGATPQQLMARVHEHFVAHPLPKELAADVNVLLRELLAEGDGALAGAAAKKLVGVQEGALASVPVGDRAGAAGSTRMGVMGRFALQAPSSSKGDKPK